MLDSTEQAELTAALTEAWKGTSQASVAVARFRTIVEDAVQSHRFWAQLKQEEAMAAGFLRIVKTFRKSSIDTKRGQVANVVGIRSTEEQGEQWVQLSLLDLTPAQVDQAIKTREGQRDAATRNLAALRKVSGLLKRHADATTVGEALSAEGITLEQFLGRAA